MAVPPKGAPANGAGWKAAGIIGGLILLAAIFSNNGGSRSSTSYGNSTAMTAVPTPATPAAPGTLPYEEIAPASVQKGYAHFRLATQEEGLVGARIYSENCYAALGRGFSWNKLDQCGSVDMAAVSLAGDLSTPDAAHFAPETAASRYLQAASANGAAPEVADQRLSALQALVARRRPAPPKARPTAPEEGAASQDMSAPGDTESGFESAGNNVSVSVPVDAEDPETDQD